MRFAHSFWSKPLMNNKFNTFNNSLTTTLTDYATSVAYIHKAGYQIDLYCDKLGKELLDFIPYDNIVILEDLDDMSIHFAAQIKFKALKLMSLDDVLIDGDLFLRTSEIINQLKEIKTDIVYSFWEPWMYTMRDDMPSYYNKLILLMRQKESELITPYHLPSVFKDMSWPNTSLIKFNSQQIKDRYLADYERHKNLYGSLEYDNTWPDIIIEQYFLGCLIESGEFSGGELFERFFTDPNANERALRLGFTHLGKAKLECQPWVDSLLKDIDKNLWLEVHKNIEKRLQR